VSERRWLMTGVVIPVLGIAALIARAEVKSRSGETFRVDITGYDPRDLLHGHYLQYRYAWDWQGEHGCICLTRRGGLPAIPSGRQVACDAVEGCDAWLSGAEVVPPRRYFIPEEKASQLEEAFRNHRAQVDLSVRSSGQASVGELYLDGRPWREVVP
jgi:uncharacterized membrane-anchored protein